MASVNKVFLLGRLGQNPELKSTSGGGSVLNLSLATSEYYKNREGEKQQKTEWHRVVAFNKLADIIAQYCFKGSQIFIEGYMQTREWEKDGQRRWTTEIIVRNVQLLEKKDTQDRQAHHNAQGGYQQSQPASSNGGALANQQNDFYEEDVPF